jgi:hypothetical protein
MGASWLSPNWGFRKKISIQNTNVDSNLTDFPLHVPINADGDFHEARGDGFDIRYTSSNGVTLLKYERESWSGGGGAAATANYWTKCNPLAGSQQEIYCYYGYAAAGDGQDTNNVWDGNFLGVWHMADLTTSTIADSTSNGYTGTKTAANEPIETTGKIYKGQQCDGINDVISTALIEASGISATTFSIWLKTSASVVGMTPMSWSGWRVINSGGVTAKKINFIADGGGIGSAETTSDIDTNLWIHICGTSTNNAQVIYYNGASEDTATETLSTEDDNIGIFLGANAGPGAFFTGDLCEARLSDSVRSAAWVKFEHANINEGDNELTWGPEEERPTGMSPAVFHPVF